MGKSHPIRGHQVKLRLCLSQRFNPLRSVNSERYNAGSGYLLPILAFWRCLDRLSHALAFLRP